MAASIDNFLNSFNSKFEPHVRGHLKNVYASLTMTVAASTVGAYVHLFTNILQGGGLLFSLVAAGLAFGLFLTPDNGKNRGTRMAMLLGFGFLTGLGMGPMLQMAMMMNPSIVPTAFMVTSVIFACFSGAALVAPDGISLPWRNFAFWTFHFDVAWFPQYFLQISAPFPGSYLDWYGCFLWIYHV